MTTNTARFALALDDVLLSLCPHDVATLAAAPDPTGIAAQIRAAGGQQHEQLRALADAHGLSTRRDSPADVPEWLRLGAVQAFAEYALGQSRTCMHAPTLRRPQPVHAVAWRPGLVTCTGCTALLKAIGAEDRRCDRCGRIGDLIWPTTVQLGPLSYSVGECPDCHGDAGQPRGAA